MKPKPAPVPTIPEDLMVEIRAEMGRQCGSLHFTPTRYLRAYVALGKALENGYLTQPFAGGATVESLANTWRAWCEKHRQPEVIIHKDANKGTLYLTLASQTPLSRPCRETLRVLCRGADARRYSQLDPTTRRERDRTTARGASVRTRQAEADLVARTMIDIVLEHEQG